MIVKHVKSFHSYCPFFQTITSSRIELDVCICRQGCFKDVIGIFGIDTQTQNLDSDLIYFKRLVNNFYREHCPSILFLEYDDKFILS